MRAGSRSFRRRNRTMADTPWASRKTNTPARWTNSHHRSTLLGDSPARTGGRRRPDGPEDATQKGTARADQRLRAFDLCRMGPQVPSRARRDPVQAEGDVPERTLAVVEGVREPVRALVPRAERREPEEAFREREERDE